MRAFLKTGIVAVLLAGLLAQDVAASSFDVPAAWAAVASLKPGDQVYVESVTQKASGKIDAVNASSISLATRKGLTTFSMPEVRQVRYVSPRTRTYQKIAIGCAMAMAGIAAVNLGLTLRQAKDPGRGGVTGIGLLPVAGAAAGTIIFAIKGKGKKIYTSR